MNRRSLLKTTGAVAAGAALFAVAGCAGQTTTSVSSDVNLLSSGVEAVLAALSVPSLNVPANVLSGVQTAVNTVQTDASQIATALTPSSTALTEIGNAVTLVASLATPFFPPAAAAAAVIQALLDLVPVVTAAVTPPAAAAVKHVYTPDEARLILRSAPALVKASK